MTDAILGLFGPLAKPECVRASRRGWLIWLRLLPAVGAGVVVFLVVWVWSTWLDFDPVHLPYYELRVGLTAIVGPLVALAFLISPAVLAGSLAGEKERGSIALLLSTQASAGDIVLSRWVGRLVPVALVAASAIPPLLWLAIMAGLSPAVTAMTLVLPAAVALGGGGFALGVSAVSKRGRDALLLVYLVEVVLMLGSLFAAPLGGGTNRSMLAEVLVAVGLGAFNPFGALAPLIWDERAAPAVTTAIVWLVIGVGGLVVAAWRLRPSCLNDGSGTGRAARRFRRAWGYRVPPVGDRPMLWKELHIERAGSLGRVGRWLGALLVAWLGLGSLILGAIVLWDSYHPHVVHSDGMTTIAESPAIPFLADWYAGPATLISFLIQWAIALRAGVTIASERERGTWDALLTSPLEPGAIVLGKLWGSLHALRWLILAALTAWTVTWACDAMTTRRYLSILAETAALSALMAASGVAMSLRSGTATRAMGATLMVWLGGYLALTLLALFICLGVMSLCLLGWLAAIQAGLVSAQVSPWFPMTFKDGLEWTFCGLAVLGTIAIVTETRVRFDRVAGRMTGGTTAVQIDEFLHGRPMRPVRLKELA